MSIYRAAVVVALAGIACGVLAPEVAAQARRGATQRGGGSGADCASPIALPAFPAALPYSESNTTSGSGNDYSSTCLGSYDSGEDLIYQFEVTETTCLRLEVEANTIWAGFAVAADCTGFGSCIAVSNTANLVNTLQAVFDPGTYYIIVDTFAPPTTATFDLTIEACPTGACCLPDATCIDVQEWECVELTGLYQGDNTSCGSSMCPEIEEGDNCLSPIVTPSLPDNLPFRDTNTTNGRGNNYVNTCLGSWDGGEDIIYEVTVASDVCLRFTVDAMSGFIGMALHDSCPIDAATCLASATSFASPKFFEIELSAGTYYLQIDTFAPPSNVDFDLKIEVCPPFGACCLNDGTCVEMTDFECAIMDGEFQGDETICGSVVCPDPLFGACCLPDDTCVELFENECDDLDGSFEGDGTACIDITCPVPPLNDACADAMVIGNGPHVFSTQDADTDGPAHAACLEFGDDQINQDVWFLYTAACTGDLLVSTCDMADFDTRLAVYSTASCDPGVLEDNLLGCSDDTDIEQCGVRAELTVPVDFGQTYLIRVGGFLSQQGEGVLVVDCDGEIPCPGDADGDLIVNLPDLLAVISNWGSAGPTGDVNASGMVDLADLLLVISNWGTDCNS